MVAGARPVLLDPAGDLVGPEQALAAKAWVRKLYDVEDEAKDLSSAERLRLRRDAQRKIRRYLNLDPLPPGAWFP